MSAPTIVIYVENRTTGAHDDASVPIDEQRRTFPSLWGNGIIGNVVGVNGELPVNGQIAFGPPGHGHEYTLGEDPTVFSSEPQNISQWVITASSVVQL